MKFDASFEALSMVIARAKTDPEFCVALAENTVAAIKSLGLSAKDTTKIVSFFDALNLKPGECTSLSLGELDERLQEASTSTKIKIQPNFIVW